MMAEHHRNHGHNIHLSHISAVALRDKAVYLSSLTLKEDLSATSNDSSDFALASDEDGMMSFH